MTVMRSLFFLVILTCVVVLGAFSSGATVYAGADAHAFEVLYGEGVNAFNTRDYEKTIQVFDQAESQGNFDPRGYFFRGLAKSRLGRVDEAAADFEYAASLELSKAGRSYSVPRALQRIQGQERLLIEQYRRQAKKKWENEQSLQKKAEFEVQKQKDRQLYNQLIENGTNAKVETGAVGGLQPLARSIPFGAKAINPFGATDIKPTEIPSELPVMTDDNIFKEDLEKTVAIPSPPRKNRMLMIPKVQHPGEKRRLAAERRAMQQEEAFSDEFEGGLGMGLSPFDDASNLFGDGDNPFDGDDNLFEDNATDQSEDVFSDPFSDMSAKEDEESDENDPFSGSDEVVPLPDTDMFVDENDATPSIWSQIEAELNNEDSEWFKEDSVDENTDNPIAETATEDSPAEDIEDPIAETATEDSTAEDIEDPFAETPAEDIDDPFAETPAEDIDDPFALDP